MPSHTMQHTHRSNRSARIQSKYPPPHPVDMSASHPQPPDAAPEKPNLEKNIARPAVPSGTVRARRVYPRYRKTRSETVLEPATPEFKPRSEPSSESSNAKHTNHQENVHLSPDHSVTAPTSSQAQHLPHTHEHPPTPTRKVQLPRQHQKSHPAYSPQTLPSLHREASRPLQHAVHLPPTSQIRSVPEQLPQNISAAPTITQPQQLLNIPSPLPKPHLNHSRPVLHHIPQEHTHHSHDQSSVHPPVHTASEQPLTQLQPHELVVEPTAIPRLDKEDLSAPTLGVDESPSGSQGSSGNSYVPAPKVHPEDPLDMGNIPELVSNIKASSGGARARPLICQDITNSNADTLRISHLPRGVTYDRLYSMVEPFGEVEDLAWSPSDPYVCDVTYRDSAAAHEAKHFLGDALVGSDSEPPLKAELRSRDLGAQLFVGDLTPNVTEEMLEAVFSELVGEPVTAILKRDPESFSPIGYGFLSFKSESSANYALIAGHRVKVGNACVRVGRAERNTHLYVSDLSANVSLEDIKTLFGKFGNLVEEDIVIIRRSYAFIRYKNRGAAEKAKRTLDKTNLKGRISVRYAEAEPLKACVAVQFHSSVPRPPNSLRDLLSVTFSKYGNCSVEIPRLANGMWRKVAFVTFHGDPIAANLAALEAVQSIRFVSSLPVCCQFARELIPRLPSRGLSCDKIGRCSSGKPGYWAVLEKTGPKNAVTKKNTGRRNVQTDMTENCARNHGPVFEQAGQQYGGNDNEAGRGADLVPIYVPISALQHPNHQMVPQVQGTGNGYSGYHWQNRMMLNERSGGIQNVQHSTQHMNPNYNSFTPLQERITRW